MFAETRKCNRFFSSSLPVSVRLRNMDQLERNGEPMFSRTSPQVIMMNIHQTVEIGTYVGFFNDQDCYQYGRIIRSLTNRSNEVFVTINRYTTRGELEEEFGSNISLPAPLNNRLISVPEIFNTSIYFDVPICRLHNILFIFKPDKILEDGYEGSENIYCLRYHVNATNQFSVISEAMFLPFPCDYINSSFPPLYKSTSYKINKYMLDVRELITRTMCRKSEKIGRDFVKGTKNMECQPEFWAYIKFRCFDVDVHGPFASKRKTVRMRSHLDITSASQSNTAEIIRFETINDFRRFDTIFGSFSRFGSTKGIPTGNITGTITQPHHVVATMGEGLNAAEPKFKRRDVRSYGIDFCYNIDRHIFYITIWYKLVRAKEDTTIKNYLAERRTLCGQRTTERSQVAENIETPYHTTIKKV